MPRRAFTWQVTVVDAKGKHLALLFDGFEFIAKDVFARVLREGLARRPEGVEPLRLQLKDPGSRVRRVAELERERTVLELGERTSELQRERTSAELAEVGT